MLSLRPISRLFAAAPSAPPLRLQAPRLFVRAYVSFPKRDRLPRAKDKAAAEREDRINRRTASRTKAITPVPNELQEAGASSVYSFNLGRSISGNLGIYQELRNRTLKQTRIRHAYGDLRALKATIVQGLNIPETDVVIKNATSQVMVRGHRRNDLMKHFEELGIMFADNPKEDQVNGVEKVSN
ncbi:hypothetical protein BDZ91DRAFT_384892 [Kalaharituber pfeilii]|nr:hypothetical protein BDZ91DRAFT_384892 [Kalaharituber pfeilii]